MGEIPKEWAAPGATLLLDAGPLYLSPAEPAVLPMELPVETAPERAAKSARRQVDWSALALTRYWSVFGAAAAGWATLAIAYCPWHLMPQSLHELGVVVFGAVAGGAGALAVTLHPEEHHHR